MNHYLENLKELGYYDDWILQRFPIRVNNVSNNICFRIVFVKHQQAHQVGIDPDKVNFLLNLMAKSKLT